MTVEISLAAFIWICVVCFLIIGIGTMFVVFGKNGTPDENDYEAQFRIVQLENGIYVVQKFDQWTNGWRSQPFTKSHFDTLDEARTEKERRIAQMKESDGFRVKRVVSDKE